MSKHIYSRLLLTCLFFHYQPFLKPLIRTATMGLQEASGEVINNHDQYEVFNDPRAVCFVYIMRLNDCLCVTCVQSDPTHSFLSKDHFVCISLD